MSTNRLKTRNLFVLLLFLSAGTLGYLTYQSRRVVVRYERTYYQETEYRTGPAAYAARVVQWTDVDEFVDGYRKSRFVRRNIPIKVYYIEVRTELINRMPVEVPLQVLSYARAHQGTYYAEAWETYTLDPYDTIYVAQRILLPLGEDTQFERWGAYQVKIEAPEVTYPVERTRCRWQGKPTLCYELWEDCRKVDLATLQGCDVPETEAVTSVFDGSIGDEALLE